MSILDDEFDLIEESNKATKEAFIKKLMDNYPISKPFLGGYKHHGKDRVGYDCFGRPVMAGDWVIFKTTVNGDQSIPGLAFGVIKSIGKKNIKVTRREYNTGWYNNPNIKHESLIPSISVFKIDDKDKFLNSFIFKED